MMNKREASGGGSWRAPVRKRPLWQRIVLWGLFLGTLLGVALTLIADHIFNVRSNLVYLAFKNSEQPLLVYCDDSTGKSKRDPGWVNIHDVSGAELEGALQTLYSGDGVKLQQLAVRRSPITNTQKVVDKILSAEINVFTFQPSKFDFRTIFREKFEPSTAKERVAEDGVAFALNANFFGPDGKPLGWVVSEGQAVNTAFRNWTGYFFVKNGRPYFGPRSLLEEIPGDVSEAAQGYPSLMRDHTIFNYVKIEPDKFFDGKKITYRSLAGIRQNGEVVFILSGNGGVLNVEEIAQLAKRLRIQHATLWDGGRALQYRFELDGFEFGFHSFNNTVNFDSKDLAPVKSPVYIGVQPSYAAG